MYNEPAAQRDQPTPFATSNTRESDARDVLGLSSVGGSRAYNHEYSSSFRESPSDASFHPDWDGYSRDNSIGRTPSADSSLYSRLSPTQHRGPYHPYQPTPGRWDESYTQDNDQFLWTNRRNDGASQGSYQPSHSPQPRIGRLGAPFHPQGHDPMHAFMDQIASELKQVSAQVTKLVEANEEHTKKIEDILGQIGTMDARISPLEARGKGEAERDGANKHPQLKAIIHSMFYEMCGVETDSNKTHRTQELCAVKPLGDGLPFEVVDKAEIWHPVWDARVDHAVNTKFLAAVVERIMANETKRREANDGKGELVDADFKKKVIRKCAMIYFRSVHKQSDLQSKPSKLEKTRNKGRSRSRRQARTRIRRQAAKEHCTEKGIPLDEAMAVLDTDYASEGRTCGSDDETSEEEDDTDDGPGVGMAERREQAGLGEAAKMVVAPVWRNPDYTAFVRWLTFKHHKAKVLSNRSEATGESHKKRRRTTIDTSKGFKTEFDPPPSKLSDRKPSGKKTPYKAMMVNWWLQEHPDFETLDKGEAWLKGFSSRLEENDLHKLDREHINELVAWHKGKEEGTEVVEPTSTSQVVEPTSQVEGSSSRAM